MRLQDLSLAQNERTNFTFAPQITKLAQDLAQTRTRSVSADLSSHKGNNIVSRLVAEGRRISCRKQNLLQKYEENEIRRMECAKPCKGTEILATQSQIVGLVSRYCLRNRIAETKTCSLF